MPMKYLQACAFGVMALCAVAYGSTAMAAGSSIRQVAQSMLKDIDQATWVAEGRGPRIVYIFFDPNCPYCHHLYVNTRPWVGKDGLQFRWVPVGVLMTTSAGKAAAILEAEDPVRALHVNEDNYSRENGFGAIEEDPLPSDATEKKLHANQALLERTGLDAVPSMLFRDKSGQAQFIGGAPPPPELKKILAMVK
jgi:thiol:disulfide interchange protein DsbG